MLMRTGIRGDIFRNNSLHEAVKSGDKRLVEQTLRTEITSRPPDRRYSFKKEFLERLNEDGVTALFLAVKLGHQEMMEYLIAQGASVKTNDAGCNNLFHVAVKHRHINLIPSLLENEPHLPYQTNFFNLLPVQVALEEKEYVLAQEIFMLYSDICPKLSLPHAILLCSYLSCWQIPRASYLDEFIENFYSNTKEKRRAVWSLMIQDLNSAADYSWLTKHHFCLSRFNISNKFLYNYFKKVDDSVKQNIHSLDLSHNMLTNVKIHEIIKLLPFLRILNLSHNKGFGLRGWVYYSGALLLAYALAENNTLEEINLTDTGLDNADLKGLVAAITQNTKLRLLDISENPALTSDIESDLNKIVGRKDDASLQLKMEDNPGLPKYLKDRFSFFGKRGQEHPKLKIIPPLEMKADKTLSPRKLGAPRKQLELKKIFPLEMKAEETSLPKIFGPARSFGRRQNRDILMIPATNPEIEVTPREMPAPFTSTMGLVVKTVNEVDSLLSKIMAAIQELKQKKLEISPEDATQFNEMICSLDIWKEEVRQKLKSNNDRENNLIELKKLIKYFNFIYIQRNNLPLSINFFKKKLDDIKNYLHDSYQQMERKYNEEYWENYNEENHKKVVNIVRDKIHRTFQYYKDASRSYATNIHERKALTSREKTAELAMRILPLVGNVLNAIFGVSSLVGGVLTEMLDAAKHSRKAQVAAATVTAAFTLAIISKDEILNAVPKVYHYLYDLVLDFLGTTAIEDRLKVIAESFSGEEDKEKSIRLAAAFVHIYREIILKLTPIEATVFANAMAENVSLFLMQSTAENYTEQELINWMTLVTMPSDQCVKLRSPQSLVQIGKLVRNAGLKCLDANGKEVQFDLEIFVDGHLEKKGHWEKTNGEMYGYRLADAELIELLNQLIREVTSDADQALHLGKIRGSGAALRRLKVFPGPLKCAQNPFKTSKEVIAGFQKEILELQKKVNAQEKEIKGLKDGDKKYKERLKAQDMKILRIEKWIEERFKIGLEEIDQYLEDSMQEKCDPQAGKGQPIYLEMSMKKLAVEAKSASQLEMSSETLRMRSQLIQANVSSIVTIAGTLFSTTKKEPDPSELRAKISRKYVSAKNKNA